MKKEIRTISEGFATTRADGEEMPEIQGLAAVFDQEISLYGLFREKIAPGAFQRALEERQDVRALIDHDWTLVLARTKAGNLTLRETGKGLESRFTPPATTRAQDLVKDMEAGNIDQMSIGFIPRRVIWEEEDGKLDLRVIEDADLFDVSVVTFPAYDQTNATVKKSAENVMESRMRHMDIEKIIVRDDLGGDLPVASEVCLRSGHHRLVPIDPEKLKNFTPDVELITDRNAWITESAKARILIAEALGKELLS